MFKKLLSITALCICLMALFGTEANAKICVFKVGGTCVFWSGSVEGELTANGLGNVNKDPKAAGFTVMPPAGDEGIAGLVYCGNPGSKKNPAPGIQPALFDGQFGAFVTITRGMLDQNGVATATAVAELSNGQLRTLDSYCPNMNWEAFNFVPCEFETEADLVEILGYDEDNNPIYSEPLDTATFHCVLPDCETLGWDKKAQKPERRQYECDRID